MKFTISSDTTEKSLDSQASIQINIPDADSLNTDKSSQDFNLFGIDLLSDTVCENMTKQIIKKYGSSEIVNSAAFRGCFDPEGLSEMIKNSIDSFQLRKDKGDGALKIVINAVFNPDKKEVVITLSDNGAGFDPKYIGKYPCLRTPSEAIKPDLSLKALDSATSENPTQVPINPVKYLGGAGKGMKWVAKVAQSTPTGELHRNNILLPDGSCSGAEIVFTSDVTPTSITVITVAHFEEFFDEPLSVDQVLFCENNLRMSDLDLTRLNASHKQELKKIVTSHKKESTAEDISKLKDILLEAKKIEQSYPGLTLTMPQPRKRRAVQKPETPLLDALQKSQKQSQEHTQRKIELTEGKEEPKTNENDTPETQNISSKPK